MSQGSYTRLPFLTVQNRTGGWATVCDHTPLAPATDKTSVPRPWSRARGVLTQAALRMPGVTGKLCGDLNLCFSATSSS